MPGAPGAGACVWLSRGGRLMRADPTQLRRASGREEACREVQVSHPMPWKTRGELHKVQKGHYLDISTDIVEGEKIRGRTHLGVCRRTSLTSHKNRSKHGNWSSQKHIPQQVKAATVCSQVPAQRHFRKRSQTGAQVTQHWRFISR